MDNSFDFPYADVDLGFLDSSREYVQALCGKEEKKKGKKKKKKKERKQMNIFQLL